MPLSSKQLLNRMKNFKTEKFRDNAGHYAPRDFNMTNVEAIIKPVKRDEIKYVMEINRTCLPENYPAAYFVELYTKYPLGFLVARVDGEVVGYIMCKVDKGFHKFQWIKKAHVVSIAVVPEFRRQKIGVKLLKQSLENMSKHFGALRYMLEVRESNPAVKFYEHQGFITQRVLKSYYSDGEDGLLMERDHWETVIPRDDQ